MYNEPAETQMAPAVCELFTFTTKNIYELGSQNRQSQFVLADKLLGL